MLAMRKLALNEIGLFVLESSNFPNDFDSTVISPDLSFVLIDSYVKK